MVFLEFSRYTNDTVGLEKLLRALQGIIQLLLANPTNSPTLTTHTQTWAPIALKQCAITRRAFRYFKFIDFTNLATARFRGVFLVDGSESDSESDFFLGMLEGVRAVFMAVYLALEAVTIVGFLFFVPFFSLGTLGLRGFEVLLHAIGILTSTWGQEVFSQAMKFWFYAISCAILSFSYQLLLLRDDDERPKPHTEKPDVLSGENPDEKKTSETPTMKTKGKKAETPRRVLFWQLIGACCDILIPGTFVGWLDVSPAVVAACSILSSVLSCIEIWKRVNRV